MCFHIEKPFNKISTARIEIDVFKYFIVTIEFDEKVRFKKVTINSQFNRYKYIETNNIQPEPFTSPKIEFPDQSDLDKYYRAIAEGWHSHQWVYPYLLDDNLLITQYDGGYSWKGTIPFLAKIPPKSRFLLNPYHNDYVSERIFTRWLPCVVGKRMPCDEESKYIRIFADLAMTIRWHILQKYDYTAYQAWFGVDNSLENN